MRVVDRPTFLSLPEGTIYAKGKPAYWEGLCIKGETIFHDGLASDWSSLNPCWVQSKAGEEIINEMLRAFEDGLSRPMEDAYGRDGCFDNDEMFLIFQRPDLETLRNFIDQAISKSNNQT